MLRKGFRCLTTEWDHHIIQKAYTLSAVCSMLRNFLFHGPYLENMAQN